MPTDHIHRPGILGACLDCGAVDILGGRPAPPRPSYDPSLDAEPRDN